MKHIALLAFLALASCGTVPDDSVAGTESELITYPAGTICAWPVAWKSACAAFPNRLAVCGTTTEQVVGCKWAITGPISYYRTCVLSCS